MAIYHLNLTTVRRSQGRSVVQLVAYVTGTPLRDERTGKIHRRETNDSEITVGGWGPPLDDSVLWNAAERAERRKDAVVGRHIIVALPHDVSGQNRWRILKDFSRMIYDQTGAPVVFAAHEDLNARGKPKNSHGHIIVASRRWDPVKGAFGAKVRELDVHRTGGPIIEAWRRDWEMRVNRELPFGVPKISRLSHIRAGRHQVPRKHLGEVACAIERRGGNSHAGEYNRALDELDLLRFEAAALEREITVLKLGSISKQPAKVLLKQALEPEAGVMLPPSLAEELARAERAVASIPKEPRHPDL